MWVLDAPFRTPGVQWNAQLRAGVFVGPHLPPDLAPYQSRRHTYQRFVEDQMNGWTVNEPSPPASMIARPLQVDAARAIARHAAAGGPQFFLADDTGLGKTLSTVVGIKAAAKLRKASTVLVIVDRPASITIEHWRRTIDAVRDGGLRWVVVTWDHLNKVAAHRWDIVVSDEGHMARHTTTKRWKLYQQILGLSRKTGHPYQVVLTATPAHTPLEMSYLIPAYAHRHDEPVQQWASDFPQTLASHSVHVSKGRYGPQWTDDEQERARDWKVVRGWLEKSDPPATLARPAPWGPAQIDPMAVRLTAEGWAAYQQEWGEFCAERDMARRGNNTAKGRAAVMRFRQKAGMVRVDDTVDWVQGQVEAGRQVAVSVQFIDTAADPIRERLQDRGIPVACIYGQGRFDAEAERLRFQRGQVPVVVFTPAASLSLHAGEQLGPRESASTTPRVGLFHQARYTGIQGRQIVGRTHRDGQRCRWQLAYSEATVEAQVAKVMVERYAATSDAVGGDVSALSRIASILGCDWMPAEDLEE